MKILILILSLCFLLSGCCTNFPKESIIYMGADSPGNPPTPILIQAGQLDKNLEGKTWVTLDKWNEIQDSLHKWEKEHDEKYEKPIPFQSQERPIEEFNI